MHILTYLIKIDAVMLYVCYNQQFCIGVQCVEVTSTLSMDSQIMSLYNVVHLSLIMRSQYLCLDHHIIIGEHCKPYW